MVALTRFAVKGRRARPGIGSTQPRAGLQNAMHLVPEGAVNDRRMLAGIGNALMRGLTQIDPAAQQPVGPCPGQDGCAFSAKS